MIHFIKQKGVYYDEKILKTYLIRNDYQKKIR